MDAHQYTSVMYVIYGTHEQTSKIKLLLIHVFTQSTFCGDGHVRHIIQTISRSCKLSMISIKGLVLSKQHIEVIHEGNWNVYMYKLKPCRFYTQNSNKIEHVKRFSKVAVPE